MAKPSFKNRYLMCIPAFLTHMCIGGVYGWSVVTPVISKELGFVTQAATDWTIGEVT